MFFLEKYTTGKANEVVKGFLATNSETAYSEAQKLLDQRFGNPVVVAEDYKKKLRGWRQISDGDSKGLEEFSDFLVRCEEAMKTMKSVGAGFYSDPTVDLRQVAIVLGRQVV